MVTIVTVDGWTVSVRKEAIRVFTKYILILRTNASYMVPTEVIADLIY